VSIKGSPYARFRAALRAGNLLLVRTAAAELPRVDLIDALAICVLMGAQQDERFDRAATRWLARLALERPGIDLDDLRDGLNALDALPHNPGAARGELIALCSRHGLPEAARILAT
jgi:hypothetical protein